MGITAAAASDLFRQPPTRFIETGNGAAAYRVVGQGPDVLFVHGWPVSGATFRSLLPHLADHVTCHLLDLPGTGDSRYDASTPLSIDLHIRSVRAAMDQLGLEQVAVVGHDSGGMIARHALAGDPRVRGFGLIDTEQTGGSSFRFRAFLAGRHVPGFGGILGWAVGRRRLRRNGFILGGAFHDKDLLDGEFDEFFLRPLRESPAHRDATIRILKTFDYRLVDELADLHRRIDVPVRLVWGVHDPFFPVAKARAMVGTFRDATLHEIQEAALFSHEEQPERVAAALLPLLSGQG